MLNLRTKPIEFEHFLSDYTGISGEILWCVMRSGEESVVTDLV